MAPRLVSNINFILLSHLPANGILRLKPYLDHRNVTCGLFLLYSPKVACVLSTGILSFHPEKVCGCFFKNGEGESHFSSQHKGGSPAAYNVDNCTNWELFTDFISSSPTLRVMRFLVLRFTDSLWLIYCLLLPFSVSDS